MRAGLRIAACCAALAAPAGCGGNDKPPASKPQRPVALTIQQPNDTEIVQAGTVNVRGTVEPAGSQVRVLGRPAAVSGGSFSIQVPLDPGANVVDVIASAPRRAPALTAFRVTREILVAVPDLAGSDVEDAESKLTDLGLELDARRGPDGFLDGLLPGSPKVCTQRPTAGDRVRKGTTVVVVASKSC
jgi:glucodextranase-like protein/PASTA domain-containing protein